LNPFPPEIVTKLLFVAKSRVPANAPIVSVLIDIVPPKFTVTVPDDSSNVTSSLDPGTETPPAPPDVAGQCAVSALSHVLVPPTQNLFATLSFPLTLITQVKTALELLAFVAPVRTLGSSRCGLTQTALPPAGHDRRPSPAHTEVGGPLHDPRPSNALRWNVRDSSFARAAAAFVRLMAAILDAF
jgi:hypothetical protein